MSEKADGIPQLIGEVLMDSHNIEAIVFCYQRKESKEVVVQAYGDGVLPLGLAQHALAVIMLKKGNFT